MILIQAIRLINFRLVLIRKIWNSSLDFIYQRNHKEIINKENFRIKKRQKNQKNCLLITKRFLAKIIIVKKDVIEVIFAIFCIMSLMLVR